MLERCSRTLLGLAQLVGREGAAHCLEEARRQRTAALARAQQQREGGEAVLGYAGAEMKGGAEHGLAVGVATLGGVGPPFGRHASVALHPERAVIDHAEA